MFPLAPQHARHALLECKDGAHHELGHGIRVNALGARDGDIVIAEARLPEVVDTSARELDPAEPRRPIHDLRRNARREEDLRPRQETLIVEVRSEVRVVEARDVDPGRGSFLRGHDRDSAGLPRE
jgi:hypothetical protein